MFQSTKRNKQVYTIKCLQSVFLTNKFICQKLRYEIDNENFVYIFLAVVYLNAVSFTIWKIFFYCFSEFVLVVLNKD